MGPVDVSTIIVSIIAAAVAIATSYSANKASRVNTNASGRVEMEKEAYERARKLDTETIERLDEESDEVRAENKELRQQVKEIQEQNHKLNEDVERISKDNYDLHRQNVRILEQNEQVLSENRRLRENGERIMRDNSRLHEEVGVLRLRFTKLQRGMSPDSATSIRERETDTNPMMPEVDRG